MKVIAGMATTEARYESAKIAAKSLSTQDWPDVITIRVSVNVQGNDLGDAAKFVPLFENNGMDSFIFLACDDDIIYPPDYVETMVKAVESDPGCVWSCHGRRFTRFPVRSYYKEGVKFHCLNEVNESGLVHAAGTGVMAFRSDLMRIEPEMFPNGFMADIWLAGIAKTNAVPLRLVPHAAGWLKLTGMVDEKDTIWARYKDNDGIQTRVINKIYANL